MKLFTYALFAASFFLCSISMHAIYMYNPIGGPVAGLSAYSGATPNAVYSALSTRRNSAVSEQYLYDRAVKHGQNTLESSQALDAVRNSSVPIYDRSVGDLGIDSILSRNPDLHRTEPMSMEDRRDLSTADGYIKLAPQK